jgi:hypothetical protein
MHELEFFFICLGYVEENQIMIKDHINSSSLGKKRKRKKSCHSPVKKRNWRPKMFSKFRNATDKARKLAIEHENCLLPFIPCFRNLINMVEQQNSSSKVQASYELCRKTFTPSGAPPSSSAIQKLCSLLGIPPFLPFYLLCIFFLLFSWVLKWVLWICFEAEREKVKPCTIFFLLY